MTRPPKRLSRWSVCKSAALTRFGRSWFHAQPLLIEATAPEVRSCAKSKHAIIRIAGYSDEHHMDSNKALSLFCAIADKVCATGIAPFLLFSEKSNHVTISWYLKWYSEVSYQPQIILIHLRLCWWEESEEIVCRVAWWRRSRPPTRQYLSMQYINHAFICSLCSFESIDGPDMQPGAQRYFSSAPEAVAFHSASPPEPSPSGLVLGSEKHT